VAKFIQFPWDFYINSYVESAIDPPLQRLVYGLEEWSVFGYST